MMTTSSEPDLLDHVKIVVPCHACQAEYEVPASLVRTSQHLLAEGCSGSGVPTCDASFYAGLIAPEAVEGLARAWAAFCRSAGRGGGLGVAVREDAIGRIAELLDLLAVQRWEGEGGSCEPSEAAAADRRNGR